MQENTVKPLSIKQAQALSQVEVTVDITLGEISLSLEELIDLAPGRLFELSSLGTTPLELKVSGESIATAYLKTDGEKIYAEICELGKKDITK